MTQTRSRVFVLSGGCPRHVFLRCLLDGAVHVALGGDGGGAINPWDVADVADVAVVEPEKIAFLVRLHALLIGRTERAGETLGLDELERRLLAVAIRDVYARAADGEGLPCESVLRAVLADLARQELGDPRGCERSATVYRDLGCRVATLYADGRHGDLLDRQTSSEIRTAPLVVLDVAGVPRELWAAVLMSIVEHVSSCGPDAALLADVLHSGACSGADESFPQAFPGDNLLDGLHDSFLRRRVRAGEPCAAAYLHAISDVAYFLHPPTGLAGKGPAGPP